MMRLVSSKKGVLMNEHRSLALVRIQTAAAGATSHGSHTSLAFSIDNVLPHSDPQVRRQHHCIQIIYRHVQELP
jgi:hypothetical protein